MPSRKKAKKKPPRTKWGTCLAPGRCQGARVRFNMHGRTHLSALCKKHWTKVWGKETGVELFSA